MSIYFFFRACPFIGGPVEFNEKTMLIVKVSPAPSGRIWPTHAQPPMQYGMAFFYSRETGDFLLNRINKITSNKI